MQQEELNQKTGISGDCYYDRETKSYEVVNEGSEPDIYFDAIVVKYENGAIFFKAKKNEGETVYKNYAVSEKNKEKLIALCNKFTDLPQID